MNVMLASLGATALYCLGMGAQWRRIKGPETKEHRGLKNLVLGSTALGMIFQTLALYFSIHSGQGINLGIFTIGSLTTLMVTMVVLLSSLRKPAENLLVTLLPVTVLTVLLAWLAPIQHMVFKIHSMMVAHVLLSVLAYGLLMVAAFQSLLLSYQERMLKQHAQKPMLKALPPLQTMEKLLFEFLVVGVVLLTLSLITGFMFLDDMFAQRMVHKTVLSLVAWGLFAILLVGHWWRGWRGRTAMRWTMSGFCLLIVAYFGWRAVVNFLLTS